MQLIPLTSLRYGDEHLIVSALSREEGRVELYVPVHHGRRSGLRYQLFQPLSILNVECAPARKGNMLRPRQAAVAVPLNTLHFSVQKSSIAQFLAEVMHFALRDAADAGAAYEFVMQSVRWLDAAQEGYANFHLLFLLRLATFLGFAPSFETFREGTVFDLHEGSFSSRLPMHPHVISAEASALLASLHATSYDTMHTVRLTSVTRAKLLNALIDFYRLQVPSFPRPRSLEVLQAVFS